MGQLKVGIIGAGRIARGRHIPCFQRNTRVALMAIADVSQNLVEQAGLDVFPLRVNKPAHGMLINWTPAWMPGEKENEGDVQTADFVDSVLEGRRPVVKAEEALQVSEVVDAIYRSSVSGSSVRLD